MRNDVVVSGLQMLIEMRKLPTCIFQEKLPIDRQGSREKVETQSNGKAEINIDYLTRRLNELIENPFFARIIGPTLFTHILFQLDLIS